LSWCRRGQVNPGEQFQASPKCWPLQPSRLGHAPLGSKPRSRSSVVLKGGAENDPVGATPAGSIYDNRQSTITAFFARDPESVRVADRLGAYSFLYLPFSRSSNDS
jgi:hypothetical protein